MLAPENNLLLEQNCCYNLVLCVPKQIMRGNKMQKLGPFHISLHQEKLNILYKNYF